MDREASVFRASRCSVAVNCENPARSTEGVLASSNPARPRSAVARMPGSVVSFWRRGTRAASRVRSRVSKAAARSAEAALESEAMARREFKARALPKTVPRFRANRWVSASGAAASMDSNSFHPVGAVTPLRPRRAASMPRSTSSRRAMSGEAAARAVSRSRGPSAKSTEENRLKASVQRHPFRNHCVDFTPVRLRRSRRAASCR